MRGSRGSRGHGHYGMRGRSYFNRTAMTGEAYQGAESHICNNLSSETNDPTTKHSRIFVGNISKQQVSRSNLFVIFSKYGTITALSNLSCRKPTDPCLFAFVQYTSKESAERAVLAENGRAYHGHSLGKCNVAETRPTCRPTQECLYVGVYVYL